jgi:hypothetical protein
MDKCSINNDFGQCKNKPTKYIFGIELCDNHYHILFNMSDNIITKLPNKNNKGVNKGKECPGWDVDASEDGQSIIPCEHEECKTTNKKWRLHEIEDQEDL